MSNENKTEEMEDDVLNNLENQDVEQDGSSVGNEEFRNGEELSLEEQLQEDLKKEKDKFLRLFAEFENYKRRTSKERIDLFKTQVKKL